MSAPVRFLFCVVTGWVVVRATALGAISGFTVGYATPRRDPPPIVPTELADSAQFDGQAMSAPLYSPFDGGPPQQAQSLPAMARPQRLTAYYIPSYAPQMAPSASPPVQPLNWSPSRVAARSLGNSYAGLPPLPVAAVSLPAHGSFAAASAVAPRPKLDRWQVSSWALLRGAPNPQSLATGGTLGGSQAGARVLYSFTRSLAASVRTSSPIGGSSGAEIAAGVRWAPLRSVPVAITAERRQSISRFGGRSDFALFVEGGLYRRPIPLDFRLDGYFQAGIVGIRRHDLFADGQLAISRPVWGRFSAGLGVWGGVQPGLYRIDAGPRISMRVRDNIYAHLDWRQRLAGSAAPASGPALTLAADF